MSGGGGGGDFYLFWFKRYLELKFKISKCWEFQLPPEVSFEPGKITDLVHDSDIASNQI